MTMKVTVSMFLGVFACNALQTVRADILGHDGTDYDFARYETIIDRMPFGRPPADFNPDVPSSSSASRTVNGWEDSPDTGELEQQLISSVRVSALNVTPTGKITVGFTDSSALPHRNYLLEVGEKRHGWTVLGADPLKRMVNLMKDGVEATLKLGDNNCDAAVKITQVRPSRD